jgi:HEAT repeat protein
MRLEALSLTLTLSLLLPLQSSEVSAKAPKEVTERAISTLLTGAQSADFDIRAMAVEGLGKAPKKRVLAVIKDALADQQWQVRRSVIRALVQLKDKSWQTAISNAMLSSNLDAAEEVFPLLEALGPKKGLPVMKKTFENPKMPQPHRYVEVLANKGGDWLIKGFTMGLKLKQKQAREAFIEYLPKLNLRYAPPLYKNVLQKQDPAIQKAVLDRLSTTDEKVDVSFVKKLLKAKDAGIRFRAAAVLATMSDKSGRKLLVKALLEGDDAKKLTALKALKHLAGKDLYPHLKQFTKNDKVSVELLGAALEIHATLKNEKMGPWLEERLTGRFVRSIPVQAAAVSVIGRVKGKAALPTLYKLLGHGDPRVRKSVARALGDLARRESIKQIQAALFNNNEEAAVKVELVRALEAINSPDCIDALRSEIGTPHNDVKEAVIRALAKLKLDKTVPDLEIILRDARNMKLRRMAVRAILRLGPTRYVRHFRSAMNWMTAEDMEDLTKEHKREMIPHIQAALISPREATRDAAISALKQLDPKTQITIFRRMALKNKRAKMRMAGLLALLDLQGKKGADIYKALVSDADKSVRVAALGAIGRLGAKAAKDLLFKATDDPDEKIRVAAAAALLRL